MNMAQGKFISIEGGDGAGKTTQLDIITTVLHQHNIEFILTREPGGTPIGEKLRALLLDHQGDTIGDETELLMMFAARAEHVSTVIKPALALGKWVVSDRFVDASFAYQGARGLSLKRIDALAKWVLQGFSPDLTLLLELPVEQGLERVNKRGAQDRFEQTSIDYKQRVLEIYRQRVSAEPTRIKRIDASLALSEVSHQVRDQMSDFIQQNTKQ